MNFTDADLNSLIDHSLIIECFEIVVKPSNGKSKFSYTGPGEIYFDHNKNLRAKLFDISKKVDVWGIIKILEIQSKNTPDEDDYFDVLATDTSGNTWISKKIHILPFIRGSGQGTIIDVPIPDITSNKFCNHEDKTTYFDVMIPGKFTIPLNKYTTYLEKQIKLDKLEFETAEFSVTFRGTDSHLGIEARRFKGDENYKFLVSFLEAVALATGVETYPSYYRIATSTDLTSFISSGSAHRPSALLAVAPIVNSDNGDPQPFIEFVSTYTRERHPRHDNMIRYWRRLYHVPKPINEVAALVLSVNIEGMVKDYFSESPKLNNDALDALIKESQRKRKLAKFEKSLDSKLTSLIANFGKPSIYQNLETLKTSSEITQAHIDCWRRLRNTLAHSGNINNNDDSAVKFRRDIQFCFDLFYKLICLCVSYSGPTANHAPSCEAIDTD